MAEQILIDHLESRLGRIQAGWSRDPSGDEMPFQVVEFSGGGQLEGSTSYSTLGLSNHRLKMADSGQARMELVMSTHTAYSPARIPQSLRVVGMRVLDRHSAILRGQTIRLPAAISADSDLSFVYAAVPGYFDEGFDQIETADGPILIVWIVPISESEATFVRTVGWPAWEQKIDELDPDLLDLTRQHIV